MTHTPEPRLGSTVTVTLSSYVSAQGAYDGRTPCGRARVRIGEQVRVGTLVQKSPPARHLSVASGAGTAI